MHTVQVRQVVEQVTSATNTHSDINQVGVLGKLASAMQLLQASLIPQTYEEFPTVYAQIKGVSIQTNGFKSPAVL